MLNKTASNRKNLHLKNSARALDSLPSEPVVRETEADIEMMDHSNANFGKTVDTSFVPKDEKIDKS